MPSKTVFLMLLLVLVILVSTRTGAERTDQAGGGLGSKATGFSAEADSHGEAVDTNGTTMVPATSDQYPQSYADCSS